MIDIIFICFFICIDFTAKYKIKSISKLSCYAGIYLTRFDRCWVRSTQRAVYHYLGFILLKVVLFESSDDKEKNNLITIFS